MATPEILVTGASVGRQGATGNQVARMLLERGIAVRRAGTFPGLSDDHLRIAVRTPADNERLLAALAEVL